MLEPILLQLPELDPQPVRWPVVFAATALLIVLVGFRVRSDLAEAMGLRWPDVALLTFGSIAAPVLNVPVAVFGGTVLAVNLGGAIVPVLVMLRLDRAGHLPRGKLAILAGAVAAATWAIVTVDPGSGVVAPFPAFLLPAGVALVGALVLTRGRPVAAGPLAFAAGTLGALVGADLFAFPELLAVARSAEAGTAMILGGAGAFDLIFISGALGLAACLFLALATTRAPGLPSIDPSAPPRRVPAATAVITAAERLAGLTPRERCLAYLARANRALEADRLDDAVTHAHKAVDALLRSGTPPLVDQARDTAPQRVVGWMRELTRARRRVDQQAPGWVEAADAVELAKRLAGALWRAAPGRVRLEEAWT